MNPQRTGKKIEKGGGGLIMMGSGLDSFSPFKMLKLVFQSGFDIPILLWWYLKVCNLKHIYTLKRL